jgi:hypothetical protein
MWDKPQYDLPDLPTNLTEINDDVLMELFAEFTGWQNYAAVQLAEAEVTEAGAEAAVRFMEAKGLVQHYDKRATVTQTKATIAVDSEMEGARADVLKAYAHRKVTKVIYENCERCVFVLSRELSRRIGQAGGERRMMRWTP